MEPTGAAPLRPTDLREIGPYRLLGRLGEGGMGTVFLARAPTGRFVAVKVVKAEFANQQGFADRFHAEVENARRVASFCTAQVLDNGNTGDSRPYMVTEYIGGTPLSDQIAKYGALDPGPLHGVALGVAAALAAIHVAGLVHRDLKPANVILSLSGPRVIDFGIARALDRETGFTMSGELLGSPGWWAPEQVRGEAVTPAVDIFAWGCLIAYAGNGRHPFGRGDPITLATRVLNTPPDLGALPAPLDELVRRATDMDPAQRPTAQDLLIALVGGAAPAPAAAASATAAVDPPTLVAPGLLDDWEPPQNVVNEPDITATFATPPPSDATAKGPAVATDPSRAKSRPESQPGSRPASQSGPQPASQSGPQPGSQSASQPGSQPGSQRQQAPQPQQAFREQSSPGQVQPDLQELARREEQAAREELARWEVPTPQQPTAKKATLKKPTLKKPSAKKEQARLAEQADQPDQAQAQAVAQVQVRQDEPNIQALQTNPGLQAEVLSTDDTQAPAPGRSLSTRWLIAAAAAVAAIAVTFAVLIVTSSRNSTPPAQSPTQAASASARPNDLGHRFALGKSFDDPQLIIAAAPQCGLKEYEGKTQTLGQLCVVRWTMLNPGGERQEIGDPIVSLLDDKGGRHDPVEAAFPAAITAGDRIDNAFVFDLPLYRKPVQLTATRLKNGNQIEVRL
ncbi:protein kinase [Nonomuraea sp. NPDC049158]|uniref:protein kinase domain-containing protein n=1 Tax=Nonomuraea sp. NPDC049158 TaxID=3155649 RepID=UPI0033DB9DA0